MHLKGLGDPKPGRVAAREGRFGDFRCIFRMHLCTPSAQADMQRGIEAAKGRMACLLCFERDHSQCHRCIVAEEMAQRGDFRLVHLGVRRGLSTRSRLRGDFEDNGAVALVG